MMLVLQSDDVLDVGLAVTVGFMWAVLAYVLHIDYCVL